MIRYTLSHTDHQYLTREQFTELMQKTFIGSITLPNQPALSIFFHSGINEIDITFIRNIDNAAEYEVKSIYEKELMLWECNNGILRDRYFFNKIGD